MKNIIITGKGLIGNRLSNHLKTRGYNVTTVDKREETNPDILLDLSLPNTVDRLSELIKQEPDLVVASAALARVWLSIINPEMAFENCRTTENTLEYVRLTKAKIILTSSRECYGNHQKNKKTNESKATIEVDAPYSAGKIHDEALTHAYHASYGLDYCIIRLSNVFGEEETYPPSDRIVPLTISKALRGEDSIIYNDEKTMNFTYVQDAVEGIEHIIKNWGECKNNTFNIAGDSNEKLINVMQHVYDRIGRGGKIEVNNERFGEVSFFKADLGKIKKFGWSPRFELYEALDNVINTQASLYRLD